MQIVWHVVIVFFLLLLIVPIFAKVYACFDVFGNIGAVSLYVFFIKIIAYKVRISDGKLIFFTEKNKKEVEVQVSQKQLRFLEQFGVQMKEKTIIKNINVYSRIGMQDAFATAMLSGAINVAISSVMGFIKNSKKSAKMTLVNIPEFNGRFLTMSLQVTGFITLVDILYAIVMSFIIIKRSEKYERI
ncbi:MAG: DUF2953 domain-containing protein [Clostridia bacterium]|nr:DUF2953 domain-containing protein [Clostridia bacterium]